MAYGHMHLVVNGRCILSERNNLCMRARAPSGVTAAGGARSLEKGNRFVSEEKEGAPA